MPEGHSVHRIARQFALHFVGKRITASSPQGRFSAGAAQLTGHTMVESKAVGKQLFLEFDHGLWLRVHLGMYGAWDFSGDVTVDAGATPTGTKARDNESSLHSIGAPRLTRLRMAESEKPGELDTFPPDPIGQVRVRLLTDTTCADLRGPTACDVLGPVEVQAVIDKLGPDPLVGSAAEGGRRFVAAVRRTSTPIGLVLMDQSIVAGIGNVYRAELLFRARLDPHTPGRLIPEETLHLLWRDWMKLLKRGVTTGQMLTMDGLSKADEAKAIANRDDRHWVYHRTGLPCRVCGTPIVMEVAAGRKLYYCPKDQI
jgi:endonuclease-8